MKRMLFTLAGATLLAVALMAAQGAGAPPLVTPLQTPNEVAVAPRIFDRYVGRYQVGPGMVMTITREGTHFFAQFTGEEKQEIFAESEKEYFLKVVEAQITFDTDASGRATSLVLRQNGRYMRAKRIAAPPAAAARGAKAP